MYRFRALVVVASVLVPVLLAEGSVSADPPPADTFHGLVPARLMDTRTGGSTIDGQFEGGGAEGVGPVGPGSVISVTIAGRGGVPASGVGAVALNVTAVSTASTFVTVWPAGATQPNASNLNLQAGVTRPNMVIVALGVDGRISLFNESGSTQLLVDVLGWFPTGSSFTGLVPARLMDTRAGGATVDDLFEGTGAVGPGSTTNVTILNRGGVPASGVGAVALNVTATGPTANSYVTVWPAGAAQPNASNLNLLAGVTTPNMVIVAVGAGGQVSLFNESGNTNLIVDVLGWFPTGVSFTGLVPGRLLDTRSGGSTVDDLFEGGGAVGPGSVTNVTISNRGGVPSSGVGAVALNVTATAPSATSYVTVWPAGATQPNASNLNLRAGVTTPNMVIVALGAGGQISLFNETGTTDLIVDVLGWFPTTVAGASTIRASVRTTGVEAGGDSESPSVSGDGRYTVYQSPVSDLLGVGNDTNGRDDIFLFDRETVTTTRISVSSGGLEANGDSRDPAISADGNFVVYRSTANNLLSPANDGNSLEDIFLYDRQLAITTRVSVGVGGLEANGESFEPAISADGRYITFSSSATNLVGVLDTNGFVDVFVHDRVLATTTRVSVDSAGVQGDGTSTFSSISGDGNFVAFTSDSTNLIGAGNDTSNNYDIFVHDRVLHTTTRVSVSSAGVQQVGASLVSAISGDGRYVAFGSSAANLVAGDSNGGADIFVHDNVNGRTFLASVDSAGLQSNASSGSPSISADGRYVLFATSADNLVPGDTNGNTDVFVRDVFDNTTIRVNVSTAGLEGAFGAFGSAISANGRFVVFASADTNLVADDTNGGSDVFLRDRGTV